VDDVDGHPRVAQALADPGGQAAVAAIAIDTGLLGACGHRPVTAAVPTLAGSHGASGASSGTGRDGAGRALNSATGDASTARRTALHKAADCIRQHGAPDYQDPVLTKDGGVYTTSTPCAPWTRRP
jgi:hypothetical protein